MKLALDLSLPSRGLLQGASGPSWLNGADIGMNFARNEYYVDGVPVALSTLLTVGTIANQTAVDSLGAISYPSANSPALSDLGFQTTWESRTNLILQSSNPSISPWATSVTNSGGISVTAASGTAPDGTNTAVKLSVSRSDVNGQGQLQSGFFTGTVAPYTTSMWMKAFGAGDVGKQITFGYYNGSIITGNILVTLSANWQRIVIPNFTLAASASCCLVMGYLQAIPTDGNTSANALIWGAQTELGATASPYIPNTASANTRAAASISATGALATLLARSTAAVAAWTQGSDKQLTTKTLIDANGTTLVGVNSSNKLASAVGAALQSSNFATWQSPNNFGFSWDGSGGAAYLVGTTTTDATARTPSGPFKLFSTGGSSNFWNGAVGTLLFYRTKKVAPQCSLPSGVIPGFYSRASNSTLPSSIQFRDLRGRVNANSGNPIYLGNTGAYNASGTNTPYANSGTKSGVNLIAPTEGAISGQADREHQWRNINLYIGSDPLTWTPDPGNPAITATIGGQDDHWTLHPCITKDFAGNAFTLFYSAKDPSGLNWRIFRATSATGAAGTWTKQGVAIDQNSGSGWPNPGLPALVTHGSKVYMYVTDNGNAGTKFLCFSSPTSGDGSVWTYESIMLGTPTVGDWDYGATNLLDAFVMKNKRGWFEMTYSIILGPSQYVGYAICDVPTGPFVRFSETLLTAQHLAFVGDPVFIEDANNFYLIWDEDNGVFPVGTSNPYADTLPPY